MKYETAGHLAGLHSLYWYLQEHGSTMPLALKENLASFILKEIYENDIYPVRLKAAAELMRRKVAQKMALEN